MNSDPAIIEAAVRALKVARPLFYKYETAHLAKTIVAAVTPLIRAAALEEAALTIEERLLLMDDYRRDLFTVRDGAAAVRALKEQP
jgi:hypothetical protein